MESNFDKFEKQIGKYELLDFLCKRQSEILEILHKSNKTIRDLDIERGMFICLSEIMEHVRSL